MPARATAEQFQLFQRYQQARHGDGDMATMSFYDYRAMVEDTPIETFIVEFRDPDDRLVERLPGRPARRRAVGGLYLLRSGAGAAVARDLRDPVADRARAVAGAAVRLSRLLGAGEPQDGLQVALPPGEVLVGGAWRMLTDADMGDGIATADATLVPESAN